MLYWLQGAVVLAVACGIAYVDPEARGGVGVGFLVAMVVTAIYLVAFKGARMKRDRWRTYFSFEEEPREPEEPQLPVWRPSGYLERPSRDDAKRRSPSRR